MDKERYERVKAAYVKAEKEYAELLKDEIIDRLRESMDEYSLPSGECDCICWGDPSVISRPEVAYVADGKLFVTVVDGPLDDNHTTLRSDDLSVESLKKILELLDRPLEDE